MSSTFVVKVTPNLLQLSYQSLYIVNTNVSFILWIQIAFLGVD